MVKSVRIVSTWNVPLQVLAYKNSKEIGIANDMYDNMSVEEGIQYKIRNVFGDEISEDVT